MLNARVVTVFVQMGVNAIGEAVMIVEKLPHRAGGIANVVRKRVNLHAIARRQDHRLVHGTGGKQSGVRLAEARFGERQLLAHFHGRASMTQTDDDQVHR
jgi:hypothetical protein